MSSIPDPSPPPNASSVFQTGTFPPVTPRSVTRDLIAGLVVFLVALPLCLGIALASGAPLFSGLISGIVGGIVIGSLSGSHTSVSGPAAGLAAVVLAQIATLGSFEAFLLAVAIAGLMQIGLGLARAGALSAFVPTNVIKGLPAAIGAQLEDPSAQIICVSGDGSFLMNVQELATVARYQLPIKILLLDNQALGMVRQWQTLFFERRHSEIDLSDNPDFVALASAFGIAAHSVATQAGLGDAIDAWLAHDGPALLHVAIDAAAGVWPLVPPNRSNAEMLDGDADELAPLPLPEKHPSKTTAITEEIPDAIST